MHLLVVAVILGVVEGVTEFLPISSTGHLILAGHLLGFTGPRAATFEVVIQLGAILAVAVIYRERFLGLLKRNPERPFSGFRGLWLLFLTCLPAGILGFFAHDVIKAKLFGPETVAWALGVGALAILAVEWIGPKDRLKSLDDVTPRLAIGVGLFQCLSLWPGFSRAAATIMGGMLCGASRSLAAEYSFVAAVPIMVAATAYDLLKSLDFLYWSDLPLFGVGFAVSFGAAWVAVKGFIRLLQSTTLRPFAWYRLILAPLVLLFWPEE